MKRWLRTLLIAVPILALIACGVIFFVVLPQLREARLAQRQNAATAPVERRDMNDVLPASGTLRPEQTINLAFEVAGTVKTVNVRVGQQVKAGDVIASLDTTNFDQALEQAKQTLIIQQANYNVVHKPPTERELAQAKAALAQAEAALAQAKAAFDNQENAINASCANLKTAEEALKTTETAYDNYVAAGYQFDVDFRPDPDSPAGKLWRQARDQYTVASANCASTRRTQSGDAAVKSAEAQVAQAKANLDDLQNGPTQEQKDVATAQLEQAKLGLSQAERNLGKTTLKAPTSGVLTTLNLTVGQVVGAGGGAAAVLADTSALHIETFVDENDVTRVAPGKPVTFTLQGVSGEQVFNGSVESISASGDANQGVVVYAVRVKVQNAIPLYLGMSADVQIILDTHKDVLAVPTRALQRRTGGGQYVIVQTNNAQTTEIDVTTGLTVDDLTEVSGEGLREGQTVVISTSNGTTGGGLFGIGR